MRSFGAHLEVLVRPDRQPAHENRLCRCGTVVSNLRASAALGPAGELSRSTVEVGILHPQKHQGNSQAKTSHAGLLSAYETGPFPPADCLINWSLDR